MFPPISSHVDMEHRGVCVPAEVLPSSLNDDFCDCTDGSDEPGWV